MANHAQRAQLARGIVLLGVESARLSTLAEEIGLAAQAEQLFNVELELARLHRKVLELPVKDPSVPPPDEPAGWVDEELPF